MLCKIIAFLRNIRTLKCYFRNTTFVSNEEAEFIQVDYEFLLLRGQLPLTYVIQEGEMIKKNPNEK